MLEQRLRLADLLESSTDSGGTLDALDDRQLVAFVVLGRWVDASHEEWAYVTRKVSSEVERGRGGAADSR